MNEQQYNYINKCFNELRKELKQEQANQLDLIKGLRKDLNKVQQGRGLPKDVYIYGIYVLVLIALMLISFKILTRAIY